MSVNSSSSDPSLFSLIAQCLQSTVTLRILLPYFTTGGFVFLPLCLVAVILGGRPSRQQRSPGGTGDVLAHHMLAIQLIETVGSVLYSVGGLAGHSGMKDFGHDMFTSVWPIKLNVHMLCCVERYLAVLRPVTYRRLTQTGGTRIRNISFLWSWLIPFVLVISLARTKPEAFFFVYLVLLILSSMIISFCSFSVLCALKRPQFNKDKGQVDKLKQKAFQTVLVVIVPALLCTVGMLVCHLLFLLPLLSPFDRCAVVMCSFWFSVPCGVVFPLMQIYRRGLLCCSNAESG